MASDHDHSLICTYVTSDGKRYTTQSNAGHTVMSAALQARVPGIDAICGGNCTCVTCHVYVEPEWISLMEDQSCLEESMLDFADDVRDTSRLACQIPLTKKLDGLVVHVPAGQRVLGL